MAFQRFWEPPKMCRGSSVIIVTRLWVWTTGVQIPGTDNDGILFSSPPHPDRLWDPPKTPIQWVLGAITPGEKRPKCEAGHSPPSSAEVIRLHGVVLS
jgi:hypothetical protein